LTVIGASEELKSRVDIATDLARKAGSLLLDYFEKRDVLVVDRKGVNDFVSAADKESESLLLGELLSRFPQDHYIGEENGLFGAASAEYSWAIDPLDGTSNFLHGNTNWCVSIGIARFKAPIAGIIYHPVQDEMFVGVVGKGAQVNGSPLAVSSVQDLSSSNIGIGHNPRIPVHKFIEETRCLLELGAGFIQVGAGALMLAHVAAGRVDVYYECHMWAWDALAGIALIKAAGGLALPYCSHVHLAQGDLVLAGAPTLVIGLQEALGIPEGRY